MSLLETRQTREYWATLGVGTLYEELPVVGAIRGRQSRRPVDGIVVLGGPHIRAESHRGVSLDDEDVVVIQTKATRLNPYVFGQGLFSADLVRLRWRPQSVRSAVICAEDDPDLRPVIDTYPGPQGCRYRARPTRMVPVDSRAGRGTSRSPFHSWNPDRSGAPDKSVPD